MWPLFTRFLQKERLIHWIASKWCFSCCNSSVRPGSSFWTENWFSFESFLWEWCRLSWFHTSYIVMQYSQKLSFHQNHLKHIFIYIFLFLWILYMRIVFALFLSIPDPFSRLSCPPYSLSIFSFLWLLLLHMNRKIHLKYSYTYDVQSSLLHLLVLVCICV